MNLFKLGEICTLNYGKALSGYQQELDETLPVRVFGTNGPIGWTKDPLFNSPSLIVGRKGAYRGVHRAYGPSWTIDTAYYLTLRDTAEVTLEWLYYRLLLLDINRMDSGSAIPSTKREDFYNASVEVPSLQTQNRIADILSAYDDLIENNRRRIALLEQAARELYREWFVRLRFPGHEHVKIVDGVPEGWERMTLQNVCLPDIGIQTGPFGSQLHQSDYSDDGVPVVMPKDIAEGRISTASIARVPEEIANRLSRHRMTPGDIVYGRRGDIGRKAIISHVENGWLCGTGCLRFRPDPNTISPRYLFELLGSPVVLGDIVNRARGSTMPNLNATVLRDVPLVVAPRTLQKEYDEFAEANLVLAQNIASQIGQFATARDLLLPRLMNGSIAV